MACSAATATYSSEQFGPHVDNKEAKQCKKNHMNNMV
ncbi:hypothetical protein SLEP1_g42102 [Rubroshorea leprosula]|uniref:Uncharacterized protein n=1 Tax=Rubroshorea leprosula TaxID=152421 RepID=A0AAV5L952_9ROSI|nr:hypothetical protein SLEP1_g42102 [Rubroshorea leprosula]